MCKLAQGLKSGALPGVLYSDQSPASRKMQKLLDSVGAKYEIADAKRESMSQPVFVVNGSFLDLNAVEEVLRT
jgi:hypothetical protein